MKSGRNASGYTIVETLIVLAVTMAMFFSAAALISGKQQAAQFSQGNKTLQGKIQQTINEVANGYYANPGGFSCHPTPFGPLMVPLLAQQQGTNQGCIFFGKAMQFAAGPAGTDPETYNIYTMVGLQGTEDGTSTNLSDIKPLLLTKDSTHLVPLPYMQETLKMPFGMQVKKMYYTQGGVKTDIGAIGFASSVGSFGSDATSQINVLAIGGTHINPPSLDAGIAAINTSINQQSASSASVVINPDGGVTVCAQSGSTNQSAYYTIGAEGKGTTVAMVIKDGPCS